MLLCRMFCESKPCIGGSNEFVFESNAHPKLRIFSVVFPVSCLIGWFWHRTVISSKLSYLVTKTYFFISG